MIVALGQVDVFSPESLEGSGVFGVEKSGGHRLLEHFF